MVTAGGFCSSTEPVRLHTHFRPRCNPAVSPLIFGCPTGIGQRSHRSQQGAFGSDIGTKDGSYLSCTCLRKGISVPVFSVKSVTAASRCISHTMDTDNANTTFIALAVSKEGIGLCCHRERTLPSPLRAGTLLHIVTFCLVAAGTDEENLQ